MYRLGEAAGVEGVTSGDTKAEDWNLFLCSDVQLLLLREWAEAANERTRDTGVPAKVRRFDALRLTIIDAKPAAIVAMGFRIVLWVGLWG